MGLIMKRIAIIAAAGRGRRIGGKIAKQYIRIGGKEILLYTLELVGLTLFLPLFGLGGSLYLVSAVVLGGLLVFSAWRVWKGEGNKAAWKMYRHSSMYLAFLFVALMVDRLVIH